MTYVRKTVEDVAHTIDEDLKYYFNNEFECLITVSKHEKAMNLEGRSPERFIAFECFDTVIKHAERVVEIASQTKTINK